ncbi:hypothetical protein K469DRAFT_595662 [Zopfia rhizophila CBS 207.26]|uniref:Uncharacterized protein n=1 Tax=Zopfia rhizophila CBS 207.26 TaxID=1314779 RepID=A0A6A6DMU4_9PEZI|nr:hypothetical protein K469DRAFT_595662 [Zopfia rhizophila CBS 207.26]
MTIPIRAHFSYECDAWIDSDLDWYIHGICHARKPSLIFGPIPVIGILAATGRCP